MPRPARGAAASSSRSTRTRAAASSSSSSKTPTKAGLRSATASKPRPRATAKAKSAVGRAAKAVSKGRGATATKTATRRKAKTSAKSARRRSVKSESSVLSDEEEDESESSGAEAASEASSSGDSVVDRAGGVKVLKETATFMRLAMKAVTEHNENMRRLKLLHDAAVLELMVEQARLVRELAGPDKARDIPVASDGEAVRKYKEAADGSEPAKAFAELLNSEAAAATTAAPAPAPAASVTTVNGDVDTLGHSALPRSSGALASPSKARMQPYVDIPGASSNDVFADEHRGKDSDIDPTQASPHQARTSRPTISPTRRSSRSPRAPARYRDDED